MSVKTLGAIEQVEAPNPTVEIHLTDGRVLRGPRSATLESFLRDLPEAVENPITGAVVNGELRELTQPVTMEAVVRPVTMGDEDGARIYRRSLTFLLAAVFEQAYPQAALTIDHSVSAGGYFCQVSGREPLSAAELKQLEAQMRALVEADLPFVKEEVPLEEALETFRKKGYSDKLRLLRYRHKPYLTLYSLGEHRDYHHGFMVPSTGYLRWFDLKPMGQGFALHYPRRAAPTQILPLPEYPKLLKTFRQYGDWLQRLGIDNTGALNDTIVSGDVRELILVSEELHELHIVEIAKRIAGRAGQVRAVLIAGPSSSGKTTFSKRLALQLLAQGVTPYPFELDNYFVDREDTPLNERGEYDYESLGALDTVTLSDHLRRLMAGEEVRLRHYDFVQGKGVDGETVRLDPGEIVILEGIHALDPDLLPGLDLGRTFRIYASCLTQLNLDRYNRISTTDTRLLRRIVRDARERGYSAQQTIQHWDNVTVGEKKYIFPYQENADEIFNSALVYELAAIKPLAEPLLRQVPYGSPEYVESKRLLAFLEWFEPIDPELIPDNSILREFVGGSILSEFHPWMNNHGEP
jgi:uridine kinase